MKKYIFTLIAVLLFSGTVFGVASNRVYYYIDILDEWGDEPITSPAITQVNVQNESGTAVAVYTTKFGTTELGSTGVITTGLSDGRVEFWYGDTAIDVTVTDGTSTYEIESFGVREHRFMLPRFLPAAASLSVSQTQDLDFTFASWIIDGDTANRLDMIPDNDSAVLAIGDGTNQANVYIYKSSAAYVFFDEANGTIEMVDYDIDLDDASILRFGTNDDFTMYSDTANTLEFDPATAGNQIKFGTAFGDAVDITWYGDLTGDTVAFDEENCEVLFTDIDLQLDDAADLIIGTDDDWVIECDSDGVLEIIPDAQGNEVRFGASDTTSVKITWYSDISGNTVVFAEEDDEVLFTDVDLQFDNDADIIMGTTDATGFTIDCDTGKTLDILAGAASDDFIVNIGLDQSGVDLKVFGATTGEYWSYDAGNDTIAVNTGNALYTMTDAETNQFKVDATGTASGAAITWETTDGGLTLTIDGAANGDYTATVADEYLLDVEGGLYLDSNEEAADSIALVASHSGGGITFNAGTNGITFSGDTVKNFIREIEIEPGSNETVLAADSGKVFVTLAGNGSVGYTLPTAAAGLTFTFIDSSGAAGDDLWITASSGDNIAGGEPGKSIKSEVDGCPAAVTLVAVNAATWEQIMMVGTWAWDDVQ